MKAKILVVDDEARIRDVVNYALEKAGFEVVGPDRGEEACLLAGQDTFDLIVLDIMLPDRDGTDVFRDIRAKNIQSPVLFLSAKSEEVDRIVGLEIGADDYMTKPFSPRELVARVRAILRRTRQQHPSASSANKTRDPKPRDTPDDARVNAPNSDLKAGDLIVAGPITLSQSRHELRIHGIRVDLTPLEFAVLSVLARAPERVYSRAALIEHAYDPQTHVSDRSIDTLIRRLRQKLREQGIEPIVTVHGIGYKLSLAATTSSSDAP